MAYPAYAAALTAIREVVEGRAGVSRRVADLPGGVPRLIGDLPDGLTDEEEARRGMSTRAEASITSIAPHPQTPLLLGDVRLETIEVTIRVTRTMELEGAVADAARDAFRAAASTDAAALQQALMCPGNLATTLAGAATGLLSGMLTQHQGSRYQFVGAAGAAMRMNATHVFRGVIRSAPAIS
jgi:hypothetical protein